MTIERKKALLQEELNKNGGVFRLAPAWVPRSFLHPGKRLKLHPADYYALGTHRGGIDERWFASTTHADNGPGTPEDEGLSYIFIEKDTEVVKITLKEAIELIGDEILGSEQMKKYGGWMMFSKFFDNMGPIPHHMHQMDEHAAATGKIGKPEAYYFPPQQNNVDNNFAHTYFGLEPGTTKEDVIDCLKRWDEGDNGILRLAKAYRLTPGTGWDVPPGVLHAPGSLLTYEPQRACDVYGMFQSLVEGREVGWELLVKDVPEDKHQDLEYIVSQLDWEKNVDPNFMENRYRKPLPVMDEADMEKQGFIEKWVVYGCPDFCAKELTVLPGKTVTITDAAAYGFITLQGHGTVNALTIESPVMIRFGDLTDDECFVTDSAAKKGVVITNTSKKDNLVMLKHFGPDNADNQKYVDKYYGK